jgi:hypothetical protein
VGLPVTATTHAHAADQQQPVQVETTSEVAASAGTPIPGNEPGSIICTMLSANAAHRCQTPAGTTNSVTFKGQVCTRRETNIQYSVNVDITSTSHGSLMDSSANGGVTGEDMLILSVYEHS